MYFDLIAAEKDFCNFLSENYEHHYYGHVTFDNSICRLPCPFSSSSNNKDFSYALYSSAIPAGWCQCWHCGIKSNWCFKKKHEISQETWNKNPEDIKNLVKEIEKKIITNVQGAQGQVMRCIKRFALAACAGVLAHEILGVDKEEPINAAIICLKDWIKERGGVKDNEATKLLNKVRDYFATHNAMFKVINSNDKFDKDNLAATKRWWEDDGYIMSIHLLF